MPMSVPHIPLPNNPEAPRVSISTLGVGNLDGNRRNQLIISSPKLDEKRAASVLALKDIFKQCSIDIDYFEAPSTQMRGFIGENRITIKSRENLALSILVKAGYPQEAIEDFANRLNIPEVERLWKTPRELANQIKINIPTLFRVIEERPYGGYMGPPNFSFE